MRTMYCCTLPRHFSGPSFLYHRILSSEKKIHIKLNSNTLICIARIQPSLPITPWDHGMWWGMIYTGNCVISYNRGDTAFFLRVWGRGRGGMTFVGIIFGQKPFCLKPQNFLKKLGRGGGRGSGLPSPPSALPLIKSHTERGGCYLPSPYPSSRSAFFISYKS